jgi:hypothetical protein
MNERRRTQQSSSKSENTTRRYSNVIIGPRKNPANDRQLWREAAKTTGNVGKELFGEEQ